mmetsp:Transcript_18213/g.53071  ORF Transcript_18213/g.53071 Transcript_18213/m.53071 type:complete len:236 (+) Transcript_18213:31-738(+)
MLRTIALSSLSRGVRVAHTHLPGAYVLKDRRQVISSRVFSTTPGDDAKAGAEVNKGEPAATDTEGPQDASDAAHNPEVAELKAQIADLQEKLEKKHDQLLRTAADAENMRRRTATDVENASKFAVSSFAKALLEVADNLERALAEVPEGAAEPQLVALADGVKLTHSQLLKIFADNGIERVEPLGEKFDPNFHEALFEMPSTDLEPGMVGQVAMIGYKVHERVLRSAKVGVVAKR